MREKLRALFAFCIVVLLCVSQSISQQVEEKKPLDDGATEQKATENQHAHANGPCDWSSCVTKTFYFSNLSQPTELQDFVNALRTIVEISRIQPLPFGRMVIVQARPEQVALAEKLADEIDKATRRFGGLGYRLDFTVRESDGDKELHSWHYSVATEARDSAQLRIGRPALPSKPKELATKDAVTGDKQAPEAAPRRYIECRILAENERTIELHVELAFSNSDTSEAGKDLVADSTQMRLKDLVTVELGKPTVIGVLDDAEAHAAFKLK
jgi:hypothetical protein